MVSEPDEYLDKMTEFSLCVLKPACVLKPDSLVW